MNKSQFRKNYLMSIILTIVATIIIFVSVISLLFSTGMTISNEMAGKTVDQNISTMSQLLLDVLFKSFYCIIGFALYFLGAIWNIVISYMRSAKQPKHTLIIVVISGWVVLFVFPVVGFLVSMVLQIWAWFLGSKD